MSIDAVAVLRIRRLPTPTTQFGTRFLVQHRGDCSLLHTLQRFEGTPLDEHVLSVRRILGDQLDAHDDPRGLFIFPDVCEPEGRSYARILSELEGAGGFGPLVKADHVPLRITNAAPGSYDELVRQARATLGDDAELAMTMTEVSFLIAKSTPTRASEYVTAREQLRASMGEAFISALEPHLEERAQQTIASQQRFMQQVERLTQERFEAPVVGAAELDQFFSSGQANAVIDSLGPGFKKHLEGALSSLGVALDELPEDDLARRLAKAAGVEPRRTTQRRTRKKR